MGDAGDLVARLQRIRDAVAEHGANRAVDKMAEAFLERLQSNTPVLTGALRGGESVDSFNPGGLRASARISTHTPLYASFRETGGTITAKNFPQLGNPEVGFFGKTVTQAGSWYMRRTVDWADGALEGVCREAISEVIAEAGG